MNKKHTDHPPELDACKKQAEEYLNNWKRAEADFANYRKDEQKHVQMLLKFGNEHVLLEAIDVLDALQGAIAHIPDTTDGAWGDGIRQVTRKFQDLLTKHGVRELAAAGQPFDPLQHEAVGTVPGHSESGRVVEVVRSGYEMHGKVIRPVRVIVSQ